MSDLATRTMSTQDAARNLGVSTKWLSEMAAQRRVPHVLIARRYRFTDNHLAEIIAMFERSPSTGQAEDEAPTLRRPRRKVEIPTLPDVR